MNFSLFIKIEDNKISIEKIIKIEYPKYLRILFSISPLFILRIALDITVDDNIHNININGVL
tara:strand:+ start:884 stop:1069 length:186 start_codon:yes stop_codon:yes gene_type:complete